MVGSAISEALNFRIFTESDPRTPPCKRVVVECNFFGFFFQYCDDSNPDLKFDHNHCYNHEHENNITIMSVRLINIIITTFILIL